MIVLVCEIKTMQLGNHENSKNTVGFPHLWTITHFVAVILSWQKASQNGNKFWTSSKAHYESQHNNTAAAGEEENLSGGKKSLSTSGMAWNITCLLPFSFPLARITTWMKGSKIHWLWPWNFIIFWSSSGRGTVPQKCQSHHGRETVLLLAVAALSPGRQH